MGPVYAKRPGWQIWGDGKQIRGCQGLARSRFLGSGLLFGVMEVFYNRCDGGTIL